MGGQSCPPANALSAALPIMPVSAASTLPRTRPPAGDGDGAGQSDSFPLRPVLGDEEEARSCVNPAQEGDGDGSDGLLGDLLAELHSQPGCRGLKVAGPR